MKSRLAFVIAGGMAILASAASAGQEQIGVPECDRFITRYEACVTTKVPPAHRVTFSQQVLQLRTSWRALAENPDNRAQLEQICRTHGAQMRRGLEPFGCEF